MIIISENNEYRYCAACLPRDAENINAVYSTDGLIWLLFGNKGLIELPNNSKVLGVIGNREQISEELLDELGYNAMTVDGKIFPHPSDALEYDLKQKGILVDNPMSPKPKLKDVYSSKEWEEEFKKYSEYESKLVKAVIIKVKK
jgi:hypothetical protein